MSKSINTKQKDLLNTQENAENNHNKNSTLVEMEKIPGTPFTLINDQKDYDPLTDRGDIWFMVMGDYRVTEETETKEEQLQKLESEKWLLIMHITIIAIKKQLENPVIHEM